MTEHYSGHDPETGCALIGLFIIVGVIAGAVLALLLTGAISASRPSPTADIPAASFVRISGGHGGGEPDLSLVRTGTPRRPTTAPVSLLAPHRGVPTLEEAKAWARAVLSRAEWRCLDAIVWYESRWRLDAVNRSSGATGLFQALPASKLRWGRDAMGQLRFGFAYASERYGSFCGGWAHIERTGWW